MLHRASVLRLRERFAGVAGWRRDASISVTVIFAAIFIMAGFVAQYVEASGDGVTQEGACIGWDISGQWQYRASAGGYGTLEFRQDGAGNLSGSWFNVASGGGGTITGTIRGASVYWQWDTSSSSYMQSTVSPDGLKMSGTFQSGQDNGTWEATGAAQCILRQPAPPTGTAQIEVRWGNHIYRRAIQASMAVNMAAAPNQALPSGVPVINYLGETVLDVQIRYTGTDLPPSLQVVVRVNGQTYLGGVLTRVEVTADGAIYRGTVVVNPQGVISPGQRQTQDVVLIDPWQNEVPVARVVMLLIDPSGYIFNITNSATIEGAVASLFVREGNDWVLWNAVPFDQTNPHPSNSAGHYGWDVPDGAYQVRVSKPCYADAASPIVNVPPPRTDVHIGMEPRGCSNVEIGDAWTATSGGMPAVEFSPGQELDTHVVVNNLNEQDTIVEIHWSTTDPNGQRVDELSGQDTYTIQPDSSTDIRVGGVLPEQAPAGPYTLITALTQEDQTFSTITQFTVVSTPTIYLPIVMLREGGSQTPTPTATPTHTATPSPTPTVSGIHGQVTDGGAGAQYVPITLRHYDGSSTVSVATSSTDMHGNYNFASIGSLPAGDTYYTRFGPNTADESRLYLFFGPDITSYNYGTSVPGGDFDIGNIGLLAPNAGATVTFPATFRWQKRNITGDNIRLIIIDPDTGSGWITPELGNVDSVTINSLSGELVYGKTYRWYLRVYKSSDSYGVSFEERAIKFAEGGSSSSDHTIWHAFPDSGSYRSRMQVRAQPRPTTPLNGNEE